MLNGNATAEENEHVILLVVVYSCEQLPYMPPYIVNNYTICTPLSSMFFVCLTLSIKTFFDLNQNFKFMHILVTLFNYSWLPDFMVWRFLLPVTSGEFWCGSHW